MSFHSVRYTNASNVTTRTGLKLKTQWCFATHLLNRSTAAWAARREMSKGSPGKQERVPSRKGFRARYGVPSIGILAAAAVPLILVTYSVCIFSEPAAVIISRQDFVHEILRRNYLPCPLYPKYIPDRRHILGIEEVLNLKQARCTSVVWNTCLPCYARATSARKCCIENSMITESLLHTNRYSWFGLQISL